MPDAAGGRLSFGAAAGAALGIAADAVSTHVPSAVTLHPPGLDTGHRYSAWVTPDEMGVTRDGES